MFTERYQKDFLMKHKKEVTRNLSPKHIQYIEDYEYKAFYSQEDGCFVATVAELPDCSGLGNTKEDAIEEAKFDVSLVLNYFQEEGIEGPEPLSHF